MSRRGAGVGLIAVSAFLVGVRYLSAAIFGSGVSSWDADLFQAMLQYVGPLPTTLATLSLAAGLGYLAWAEWDDRSARRRAGRPGPSA